MEKLVNGIPFGLIFLFSEICGIHTVSVVNYLENNNGVSYDDCQNFPQQKQQQPELARLAD